MQPQDLAQRSAVAPLRGEISVGPPAPHEQCHQHGVEHEENEADHAVHALPGHEGLRRSLGNPGYQERRVARIRQNPMPDFVPPFWDESMSREELADLVVTGYKRFYLRPAYIMARLASLSSFGEFKPTDGLVYFDLKTILS